jgi:ribonuclease E
VQANAQQPAQNAAAKPPRQNETPKPAKPDTAAAEAAIVATAAVTSIDNVAPAVDSPRPATPAPATPADDTADKPAVSAESVVDDAAPSTEGAENGEGTGRRRRGRRGGRRRRRGGSEAGVANEGQSIEGLDDDEQDDVIATSSQPEFDFEEEELRIARPSAPAATPVTSAPSTTPVAVAPIAVATAVTLSHDAEPAVTPEQDTVAPTPQVSAAPAVADKTAVEVPQPESKPELEQHSGFVTPAIAPEEKAEVTAVVETEAKAGASVVETVKQEIAQEAAAVTPPAPAVSAPAVSFTPTPEPEPAATESVAQQATPADTEAKPTPSATSFGTSETPTPAAGSTGSLFFVADQDTPASVTRSLFDPVPTSKPAQPVETDSVTAHNDDEKPSEPDQESTERSA